jgi:hypothetical protein
LNLLRQQRPDKTFEAIGSKRLATILNRQGGAPSVPGLIRGIRERITAELRKANIECGRQDVIMRTDQGYQLKDWLTVQDASGANEPVVLGQEESDYLRDVPVEPHEDVPVRRTVGTVTARRTWILEQVAKGRRMRAPAFAAELGCSDRTVKRDLDALADQIEFEGSPNSGYYRLRQAKKAP